MTLGQVLNAEMGWLAKVVDSRMRIYFQLEVKNATIEEITAPEYPTDTLYGAAVQKLNFEERVIMALAIAPHVKPQLLDAFFMDNSTYKRRFTEFGGATAVNHTGFLPTGDTALFILSGDDTDKRISSMQLLTKSNLTGENGIIDLHKANNGEPAFSGLLTCKETFLKALFGL